MRFSAAIAMCAAPLALAGSLQADLVARGAVGVETRNMHEPVSKEESKSGSKEQSKDQSKGSVTVINNQVTNVVQSSTTEVVIIWVNNGGGAATSTVTETKTVTAGAGAPAAAVQTHEVIVGGAGGLVYTPESINAAVGDMVVFTFMSQNHTVTQSAFDTPCKKLADGMDSGFMANANNTISPPPQMAMQVTVATPIWFYCRQKAHCGKGMTFSINPTAAKTQAQFKSLAISQNGTGTASPIAGGSPAPAPPAEAAPPAAAPPAPAPPAATTATPPPAETAATSPAAGSGMAVGTGTINSGGACSCACLCGVAAFPNAAVQGLGGIGGLSGAMPMAMLEK